MKPSTYLCNFLANSLLPSFTYFPLKSGAHHDCSKIDNSTDIQMLKGKKRLTFSTFASMQVCSAFSRDFLICIVPSPSPFKI